MKSDDANLAAENHRKQMNFLRQSQQEIRDENKRELAPLAAQQTAIKEVIEAKLSKKVFG